MERERRYAGLQGGPEIVPLIVPSVPAVPGSLITLRVETPKGAASVRVAVMPPEAPYDIYDNELSQLWAGSTHRLWGCVEGVASSSSIR